MNNEQPGNRCRPHKLNVSRRCDKATNEKHALKGTNVTPSHGERGLLCSTNRGLLKPTLTQAHVTKVRSWIHLFPVMATFLCLLFSVTTLCSDAPAPKVDPAAGTKRRQASIVAPLVNLNELLRHQQALVEQCAQFEQNQMAELRRLVEFEHAHERVHLKNPIALKMPAVCLLLDGGAPHQRGDFDRVLSRPRLELVNWLYDRDELLEKFALDTKNASALEAARIKRQTAAAAVWPGLVESHWLNLANTTDWSEAELANEISDDLHSSAGEPLVEQVERLIADIRFKEAARLEQDRLATLLSPVILVPGLAGSRLEARVLKKKRVNIICKRQRGWHAMWLSLRSFLPFAIDCWIDNARLEVLDPSSNLDFTRQPDGVESRVPDFGSIQSVRHLDLKSPSLTKYFDSIIEQYLSLGYQADKNLFAAPYDFRLAPQQIQDSFYEPLRELVEMASEANGLPVTLVCHSMGCTHLLIFLRKQTSAWRQAKVRKLIAISSPWAGTMKALKALIVGEQFDIPLVSELKMRQLARTFPSIAFLLPQAAVFGMPDEKQLEFNGRFLVETPTKSYRANQLEELLKDANLSLHWNWFERTVKTLLEPLDPLSDVKVDCIHSLNIPTVETIVFRNQTDFPDGDYELVEGDGDGTVNKHSLLVCARWAAINPKLVKHKIIMNTSHSGILSHKEILDHIARDVTIS